MPKGGGRDGQVGKGDDVGEEGEFAREILK
jgi:hypothetical protein